MFLIQDLVTVNPTDISQKWLQKHADNPSLALKLVPFAGIAFLWFTGVLRDWLDDREDRFFSTVFLGSGILSVAMLFLCAAIFGAVFGTYTVANDRLADGDVYVFGYTCTKEILGNYTVRIMGVYMCSIAAIWTRTSLMPRWLTNYHLPISLCIYFFCWNGIRNSLCFPVLGIVSECLYPEL